MPSLQSTLQQIEQAFNITFNESTLSSSYRMKKGTVTELKINNTHFENFDLFTPFFETIQKLDIWWDSTFNEDVLQENLRKFTELKELSITIRSVKCANEMMELENLKDLSLWLKLDNKAHQNSPFTLDFQTLQNIKVLSLSCRSERKEDQFVFTNMEHLKQLQKLDIECDCQIRLEGLEKVKRLKKLTIYEFGIENVPNIPSLTTLSVSHRFQDKFHCPDKFPELKNLKIEGFNDLKLGSRPELKVLVMGAREFDLENADCFDHLPNLEQLSLTMCDMPVLKKIGQLKKLKMLDLSENYELEDIEELEGLQELEKLNLFDNKISDIRVLNKLPKLKLVDLARNNITEEEAKSQLDKPEIACFMGRPHVPFLIGFRTF